MDLTTKAQWHLDINNGLVPILETPDGTTIHESEVIMAFANNYGQNSGYNLWPHTSVVGDLDATIASGKMKLEMLKFSKINNGMWPALGSGFKDETKVQQLRDNLVEWEEFFTRNLNGADYLSGTNEPMMIDVFAYPIAERLVMLE